MLHWQDAAEGNHEKLLLKLATKGVVKLFNVIQQQQMARNEEKGRAEKGSFGPIFARNRMQAYACALLPLPVARPCSVPCVHHSTLRKHTSDGFGPCKHGHQHRNRIR